MTLFPNTPVVIFHLSGHEAFVKSVALRLAGVDETTPDPQGGYYEKDKNGRLTGYLSGQPAVYSVKNFPNPTPGIARLAAEARAAKGVTTASEFAIMNIFVLEGLQEGSHQFAGFSRAHGGWIVLHHSRFRGDRAALEKL